MAAACGTRAHDRAVDAMRSYAAAHGAQGRVTCSNGIGGMNPRTPDFICDVALGGALCDEYEVRRTGGRWRVALRRRGVACVLPA